MDNLRCAAHYPGMKLAVRLPSVCRGEERSWRDKWERGRGGIDRGPHGRCAGFKPGIISCITEIQKVRVKGNKLVWRQRPEAVVTHTRTRVPGDSTMSHPGITALSKKHTSQAETCSPWQPHYTVQWAARPTAFRWVNQEVNTRRDSFFVVRAEMNYTQYFKRTRKSDTKQANQFFCQELKLFFFKDCPPSSSVSLRLHFYLSEVIRPAFAEDKLPGSSHLNLHCIAFSPGNSGLLLTETFVTDSVHPLWDCLTAGIDILHSKWGSEVIVLVMNNVYMSLQYILPNAPAVPLICEPRARKSWVIRISWTFEHPDLELHIEFLSGNKWRNWTSFVLVRCGAFFSLLIHEHIQVLIEWHTSLMIENEVR